MEAINNLIIFGLQSNILFKFLYIDNDLNC